MIFIWILSNDTLQLARLTAPPAASHLRRSTAEGAKSPPVPEGCCLAEALPQLAVGHGVGVCASGATQWQPVEYRGMIEHVWVWVKTLYPKDPTKELSQNGLLCYTLLGCSCDQFFCIFGTHSHLGSCTLASSLDICFVYSLIQFD